MARANEDLDRLTPHILHGRTLRAAMREAVGDEAIVLELVRSLAQRLPEPVAPIYAARRVMDLYFEAAVAVARLNPDLMGFVHLLMAGHGVAAHAVELRMQEANPERGVN